MAPIRFLDLPLTVRNHIYADLLVPQSVSDTKIFFEPININILFTNRQIYKESSDIFYSQNLFTVIETNDTSLIFNIPEKHVTIFARNPVNVEHCKRIAMTVEMYMFDNRLPAFSRPSSVVTAAALPTLFHWLWMPKLHIWSQQSSLSMQIKCRFSYTHEVLENHLIGPITGAFLCPTFAGILSLDPTISEAHAAIFYKRFVGTFDPRGNLNKLQSLQYGAVVKAKAASWVEAADIYHMSIRYAHIIWKCHLEPLQGDDGTQDLQTVLWAFTSDLYADRAIVLINKAQEGVDSAIYFEQARVTAEEGIAFLSGQSPFSTQEIDTTDLHVVEKRKAKISFRASVACEGLGDRDTAVEYVQQCIRYEPETGESLRKRIDDLMEKEQTAIVRKAVLWKEESAVQSNIAEDVDLTSLRIVE